MTMVKSITLRDDNTPGDHYTTEIESVGTGIYLFSMYTEGYGPEPLFFSRKEARQLRNWLNKALEAK